MSDFGISRLHDGPGSITIAGPGVLAGSQFYLAVELVLYEPSDTDNSAEPHEDNASSPDATPNRTKHAFHTKQSDVWAFGMVLYVRGILQILSSLSI